MQQIIFSWIMYATFMALIAQTRRKVGFFVPLSGWGRRSINFFVNFCQTATAEN